MRITKLATNSNMNVSRAGKCSQWFENKGKRTELVKTIVIEGWEGNKPIDIMPIGEYDQTAELDLRTQIYSEMDSVSITFSNEELGIESDEINTKIIVSGEEIAKAYEEMTGEKPAYEIINGFRRTFVLPIVNAILVQLERDPIKDIPHVKHGLLTLEERTLICNKENTMKNKGVQQLTDWDYLEMCYNIIFNCPNFKGKSFENTLCKGGVGRGQAQKFGAVFDLNALTDGMALTILRGNTKLIAKLDKESLRKMYKQPKDVADWVEASKEEIIAYFNNPVREVRAKAASAADMKTMASQTPCVMVRDILSQASTDDLQNCNKYLEYSVQINVAVEAIMGGTECPINGAISDEIARMSETD